MLVIREEKISLTKQRINLSLFLFLFLSLSLGNKVKRERAKEQLTNDEKREQTLLTHLSTLCNGTNHHPFHSDSPESVIHIPIHSSFHSIHFKSTQTFINQTFIPFQIKSKLCSTGHWPNQQSNPYGHNCVQRPFLILP